MRLRWPVLLALAVATFGAPALADTPPSRWDRAKSPVLSDAWDLHVRVSEEIHLADSKVRGPERMTQLNAIRDELERAGAATSPDVRLRFDLGEVYQDLDHFAAAIAVLEPALALAPDHPDAESAWNVLATAHAKLDHSREEIRGYDKILELTVDIFRRVQIVANRAEAEMRLGNLDDALLGYRDAIALSDSVTGVIALFEANVLARWGLAVALDRSGDPNGGLREAALAMSENGFHIIQDENVFFVPRYEIAYYLGLGKTALAQKAMTPRDALELWSQAEDLWGYYVEKAEASRDDCERVHGLPAGKGSATPGPCPEDRWLPLARAHLARAQKERASAEKRAGTKRAPRGHVGDHDSVNG
jgi:tetratricopeptide (TPR) repeat protein